MIDIKKITKSFGSLQVLKGIDLHIDRGEVVSIVGPSGAGKTTLLQILGTLDRPDTGTVCVDDINTTQLSQKKLADFRNRHIGFVFQFHQLLPEFTALENIMIPAYIAGSAQKAAKERAQELLSFMGLSDRAHHKPSELSGGEKQRIALPTSPQALSTLRIKKNCTSFSSTSATSSARPLSSLPTMRASPPSPTAPSTCAMVSLIILPRPAIILRSAIILWSAILSLT